MLAPHSLKYSIQHTFYYWMDFMRVLFDHRGPLSIQWVGHEFHPIIKSIGKNVIKSVLLSSLMF